MCPPKSEFYIERPALWVNHARIKLTFGTNLSPNVYNNSKRKKLHKVSNVYNKPLPNSWKILENFNPNFLKFY